MELRKSLRYMAIAGTTAIAIITALLTTAPPSEVAQAYVVGGELEAPQIAKGVDYTSILVVAGVAAASILIGLAVASKLREKSE